MTICCSFPMCLTFECVSPPASDPVLRAAGRHHKHIREDPAHAEYGAFMDVEEHQ